MGQLQCDDERQYLGHEEGKAEGMAEGQAFGETLRETLDRVTRIHKHAVKIAIWMKDNDFSAEAIQEITSLSSDEIDKL